MARDISTPVSGVLTSGTNAPIEVYDVYLEDETLHFAAFDRDIEFFTPSGDPETYLGLGVSRDPIRTSAETTVDSVTIRLDNVNKAMSSYVANNELRGRKIIVRKIFADISGTWDADDDIYLFNGIINRPSLGESVMEIECVSRVGTLEVESPRRLYDIMCPWRFAGTGCTDGSLSADQLLNAQSGTVKAGSTTTVINDNARTEAANYWKSGQVEFTSGDYEGEKRLVISSVQNTSFTLDYPLPGAPAAGDGYTIKRGCDKTITRCSGLSNSAAFGGFYTVPFQLVVR
jgi:hypothetical protein